MERKTWRKLLTLLISILLVCGSCFTAYAENTANNEFVIKGKTLVKYTGMGGEVTVPEGIEVLGDEAFQETAITKINLPETVKEIGHHCFFACNSLKEITLPASLEGLEDKVQAFGANYALEAFSVAEGGHYITVDGVLFTADGKTLVYYPDGRRFTEYSIPEGTERLAQTSFDVPSMEILNIPSTMKSVGGDYVAFTGLRNLREINVSPDNKTFRSVDGVLYTSDTLLCYPNDKAGKELKAKDFPAGLKRIAHNSFWGNHYLENVEFPEGLEYLGGKVFLGALCLKTVVIPASIKTISYYTFADCMKLERVTILNPDIQPEDITVDNPKKYNIFWDASKNAVLCGYAGGGLQAYAKKCGLNFEALNPELEIVDEIETESAAETVEETVQDIPETVTEPAKTNEDDFVIQGKTLVKYRGMGGEVTVPEGVEVLAQWAFESSYVTKVNLPETLKEIECYCFYGCRELEDITLPASLEKLGNMQAFAYNHSLKAINVAEGNPYFVSVDGVLFNKNKTKLLYYPAGRNQGGEYAIPEGVTELGGSAIQDTGLTAIELPSTFVKMYCGNDFSDNRGLTEIRVAKGNPVFHSVDGLLFDNSGTLICYPSGLTKETLGANDFPAEMKAIGPYAFQFAQHLKNIEIPEGIKTIEWMCFTFSPSLQSMTVPASVNFIAGYAFAHCDNLEKVTILNPDAVIITDDERFSDDYRATMDFNIIGYSPKAVLYGYENSTAQMYAAQLKDAFESLGEAPAKDPNATPEPIAVSDFMPECQK